MVIGSPIVMQTLWRSRGTYFWSLFRKNPQICAFIEPLHEDLATKTQGDWNKEYESGVTNMLRHPEIDRHYFSEYPILPDGGTRFFSNRLSYDRFALQEDDVDYELSTYLISLKNHAAAQGRQAFFKFTRGGLRAEFIAKTLGGTQIYLNRPPAEIHASSCSFGIPNYFSSALMHIIFKNYTIPFCMMLIEKLQDIAPMSVPNFSKQLSQDMSVAISVNSTMTIEQTGLLTATFWLAYLLEGLTVADIFIDTERLGCDPKYKTQIGEKFSSSLGRDPFRDYRAGPCEHDFSRFVPALKAICAADPRLSQLLSETAARAASSLGAASLRLFKQLQH